MAWRLNDIERLADNATGRDTLTGWMVHWVIRYPILPAGQIRVGLECEECTAYCATDDEALALVAKRLANGDDCDVARLKIKTNG